MTARKPEAAADLVARVERLVARRAFREAHELCLSLLERDPKHATAHFLLGAIAAEHRTFGKAEELFARAIALDGSQARFHAHRAKALIALGRRAEAAEAVARAGALEPNDALTLDTIGVAHSFLGAHAAAAGYFARAAARDPNNANYQHNLAVSQQFSGDFAAAAESYRRCLALDPKRRSALAALVQLEKQTRERNVIAELEAAFAEEEGDINAGLHLGHALAKTYEDLGEHARALDWLLKAKALKKGQAAYSADEEGALFDAVAQAAAAMRGEGEPSSEPIFVVGMPRTGTTLVDRILSSHPDVMSAGELDHFSALLRQRLGAKGPHPLTAALLAQADKLDPAELGVAYVKSTRLITGKTPRFIDKMPRNFMLAGLIHRALPNARIICLRRNPMDACLSNFRQIFNTESSYYRYTYDLEDTARHYVLFDRLVAHWRATLPTDRFMEVSYEALVADLENEARRLLAFCDLSWDPRCLSFHENEAPVATASSVQVRSPIYASSVGRWRKYGEGLAPMRRVLEAAGIRIES